MKTTTKALRIVIPGGTGQIGRILTRHFSGLGHHVTVLTRSAGRARAMGNPPGLKKNGFLWRALPWDAESLGDWASTLEDVDVLINLTGRSVNCRYNAGNRRQILESRLRSTEVLGEAIRGLAHPPKVWMNASTATIYRHSFDRPMDEADGEVGGRDADAPASWRFSIDVATRWEASFFGAVTPRTRKLALRGGLVMGPDPSGAFGQFLRLVRLGLGGAAGSGKQYMSWIHDQDFARAVDYLIEHEEVDGAVNVTAPTPLPNNDFMRAVREAWGIGFGLPAREWMLGVAAFVHGTESELLLKSRRVVPGRLLEHGFQFEFATWPEAARDLVGRVREREVQVKSKERIQRSLEETRERTT
jgi:uncharacterized protein (TIGR01777 family)